MKTAFKEIVRENNVVGRRKTVSGITQHLYFCRSLHLIQKRSFLDVYWLGDYFLSFFALQGQSSEDFCKRWIDANMLGGYDSPRTILS